MAISKSPAFQFYAAEYLADENVALMTLEEEGAYTRAMAYCWREGSIPADNQRLAILLKGASLDILNIVRARFREHPKDASRLIHLRLEKERRKQEDWRKKSSDAGRKSGKVRREKKLHTKPTFANGSTNLEPPYEPNSEPNTNSSSSFSSSSSITSKAKSKTYLPSVEDIYSAYPRKDAPVAGKKAIENALKRVAPIHDAQWLFDRTAKYAELRKSEDKKFTPLPATWFNRGSYEDEALEPKPTLHFPDGPIPRFV